MMRVSIERNVVPVATHADVAPLGLAALDRFSIVTPTPNDIRPKSTKIVLASGSGTPERRIAH
jgi:hypothetical protein